MKRSILILIAALLLTGCGQKGETMAEEKKTPPKAVYENITAQQAKLMLSATNEKAYLTIPTEYRDKARAAIFKNMLLTTIE